MNNLESYSRYEFHAHVYYCRDTFERAKFLIKEISSNFSFEIGTMHEKLVGPHPFWSCQVKFYGADFGPFVQWLILNRGQLNIFIHLCTDNNIIDHTEYVCWLGESQALKLNIFD